MALVRPDALQEYGGGPRQRRSRGYVTVREPAKGFFIAGSSIEEVNGIYFMARNTGLVDAARAPQVIYKNDNSGWLMVLWDGPKKLRRARRAAVNGYRRRFPGSSSLGSFGPESSSSSEEEPIEWVFVCPRGRERFKHKGDTIIPGAGRRWSHLRRGNWKPEEVVWCDCREDEYETGNEDEGEGNSRDVAPAARPKGANDIEHPDDVTRAKSNSQDDPASRGAIVEDVSDDEDELPWQVIAVLDRSVLQDLRNAYRHYLRQIQIARAGAHLPRAGPPGLENCCETKDTCWLFRVTALDGIDVRTAPSNMSRRRGRYPKGQHIRVAERRGNWLRLAQGAGQNDIEEQWVYRGDDGGEPSILEVSETDSACLIIPPDDDPDADVFDRPFEPRLQDPNAAQSSGEAIEHGGGDEPAKTEGHHAWQLDAPISDLEAGTLVGLEGMSDNTYNSETGTIVPQRGQGPAESRNAAAPRQKVQLSKTRRQVMIPRLNLRPVLPSEAGSNGRAARILGVSLQQIGLAPLQAPSPVSTVCARERLERAWRATERDTLDLPEAYNAAQSAYEGLVAEVEKLETNNNEGIARCDAEMETLAPHESVERGMLGLRGALAARAGMSDSSAQDIEDCVIALRQLLGDEQKRLARQAGLAWPVPAKYLASMPPESSDALQIRLTLTWALLRCRRDDEALQEARTAKQLHASTTASHCWLGCCLLRRARRDEGYRVLQVAVDLGPLCGASGSWGHSTSASMLRASKRAERSKTRAEDAYSYGDFLTAAERYGAALNDLPIDDKWGRALLLASRAACYRRGRLFWRAIEDCDKALALFPRYARAVFRRAVCLLEVGCATEAVQGFEALLRIDRSWPKLSEWLVRSHAQAKRSQTDGGSKAQRGNKRSPQTSPHEEANSPSSAGECCGDVESADYYTVLGVTTDATEKQLKRAYRLMSLKYHPDKQGGSTRQFQRIAKAYETLADPAKRRDYDDGVDTKKKKSDDSSDSEREERSLREEVERKYFPERFKFWPFGDPFIEKRKLRARERRSKEARPATSSGSRRHEDDDF